LNILKWPSANNSPPTLPIFRSNRNAGPYWQEQKHVSRLGPARSLGLLQRQALIMAET
jgi:hypothetical protein